jgi:Xaa-Pro aminopeptidase
LNQKNLYIDPLKISKVTLIDSVKLRAVKSSFEIKLIQKATDIVVNAISHIKK